MTYRPLARQRWPRAAWIAGDGPYATVSDCPPLTVELHRTRAKADATLDFLTDCSCGHCCTGRHRIVDLAEAAVEAS